MFWVIIIMVHLWATPARRLEESSDTWPRRVAMPKPRTNKSRHDTQWLRKQSNNVSLNSLKKTCLSEKAGLDNLIFWKWLKDRPIRYQFGQRAPPRGVFVHRLQKKATKIKKTSKILFKNVCSGKSKPQDGFQNEDGWYRPWRKVRKYEELPK